jgi:hypothetical protein
MFSINNVPLIIQIFSNIGQLLMTIALVVFTLIYVIYTKKMLDQHYSIFVALTGLTLSGKSISANIVNHGTSIALNVSIIAITGKNKSINTKLNGPVMLMEGEQVTYNGELSSNIDNSDIVLEISYQSHTRKTRTEVWKIKNDIILYLGKK